ncbi:MAG: 7TM-DISM domain-containing protein [Pseudomonadota bacterium]
MKSPLSGARFILLLCALVMAAAVPARAQSPGIVPEFSPGSQGVIDLTSRFEYLVDKSGKLLPKDVARIAKDQIWSPIAQPTLPAAATDGTIWVRGRITAPNTINVDRYLVFSGRAVGAIQLYLETYPGKFEKQALAQHDSLGRSVLPSPFIGYRLLIPANESRTVLLRVSGAPDHSTLSLWRPDVLIGKTGDYALSNGLMIGLSIVGLFIGFVIVIRGQLVTSGAALCFASAALVIFGWAELSVMALAFDQVEAFSNLAQAILFAALVIALATSLRVETPKRLPLWAACVLSVAPVLPAVMGVAGFALPNPIWAALFFLPPSLLLAHIFLAQAIGKVLPVLLTVTLVCAVFVWPFLIDLISWGQGTLVAVSSKATALIATFAVVLLKAFAHPGKRPFQRLTQSDKVSPLTSEPGNRRSSDVTTMTAKAFPELALVNTPSAQPAVVSSRASDVSGAKSPEASGFSGLLNRRDIMMLGETFWEQFNRYRRPCSIAVLRVREYYRIREALGVATSDRATRLLALSAMRTLRTADKIAETDNAAMIVLLPETKEVDAQAAINRVGAALRKRVLPVAGTMLPLDLDAVIRPFDDATPSFEAALKAAEHDLEHAATVEDGGSGSDFEAHMPAAE